MNLSIVFGNFLGNNLTATAEAFGHLTKTTGSAGGALPCVMISVYRELSHVLLSKDYSCEPPAAGLDNIMCGDYPYVCKSNHAGALFNDWKKEVKFLFTGSV